MFAGVAGIAGDAVDAVEIAGDAVEIAGIAVEDAGAGEVAEVVLWSPRLAMQVAIWSQEPFGRSLGCTMVAEGVAGRTRPGGVAGMAGMDVTLHAGVAGENEVAGME